VARFGLTDAGLLADVAAIRTRFGERTTALVETTRLRRKAAAKFAGLADISDWLFTDEALQQATTAAVARHRALRLTGAVVHDVTCSIGTELAALGDTADFVMGSDLDEVRIAMARNNLGSQAALFRADALQPISRDTVVLLDPARRSGGQRRRATAHLGHPQPTVRQVEGAFRFFQRRQGLRQAKNVRSAEASQYFLPPKGWDQKPRPSSQSYGPRQRYVRCRY
jgi:hypothetical protein